LLKTLEEPPPSAVLILIGTSPSRQLPTIRSRSQIVRFSPLQADVVAQLLVETGTVADPKLARRAAELCEGSVERARELADPKLWAFRDQLLSALGSARLDGVRLARAIQAFVDEAGKEASRRRDRLRIVIDFTVQHYRSRLRTDVPCDDIIRALDASLAAQEQVDRNANLGLVIQHWCEELSGFSASVGARLSFASDG
jgi:DNA polymerase-3 subunit delta'